MTWASVRRARSAVRARRPRADRLAAGGLKYNRFHTTALCAPTRAALLSGRNHHSVGMGSITETATSAPGNSSLRPNTKAPLAMTLKLNGYSTAQFGKCHEVPVWQSSPMGPFDAWPSGGGGFETFYGFIGGENNQWDPALYDGTTPVEPPATPEEGYHLTEDLADRAVSWIRQQKALMPDKPFFVYFAPGAAHAPHHVPKEWADKYRGQFDDGWDVQRERTFARQKELGVIPADADLTVRHAEIPAWDDMPDELKPVLARQMEVFAGFLEHTDHHVGRAHRRHRRPRDPRRHDHLLHHRRQRRVGRRHPERRVQRDGELQRDGCARDTRVHGEQDGRARLAELVQPLLGRLGVGDEHAVPMDQAGGVALGRYPQRHHRALAERDRGEGWAAVAVHPRHRRGADDPRSGRAPGTDVRQRCAAVAHGGHEHAVHASTKRDAPERHDLQYFEMFANRGIYYKGWSAVTKHRTPWVMVGGELPAFDDDIWELYDGNSDYSQAHDLAADNPEMLHKLQRLWLIEATKYNVLPMDDRTAERLESRHCRTTDADPRELAAVLSRDGTPVGEQRGQHQEQVVLGHRRRRGPVRRRRGSDHRPGWPLRRLGRLRQGRQSEVRVQRARHPGVRDRGHGANPRRCPPGAGRVRLRRRRARQGRRRHPLLRRQRSRRPAASKPPNR